MSLSTHTERELANEGNDSKPDTWEFNSAVGTDVHPDGVRKEGAKNAKILLSNAIHDFVDELRKLLELVAAWAQPR